MIEIEGLPEGWKGVAYRRPYPQEYILKSEGAMKVRIRGEQPWLIIERIKPRRVVLEETEETEEKHLGCKTLYIDDTEFMIRTMANLLGAKIKELRKEKGLTLEQLAEIIGSGKSYIWDLENKGVKQL